MFQEYQIQKQVSFSSPIIRLAMSQNQTLVVQTQNQILITHSKNCKNTIELISYIQKQLKMSQAIKCSGLTSIPLETREQNRSCFGLILNSSFWVIVVCISIQNEESVQVQLERVRQMTFSQKQQVSSLHTVNLNNKNKIMIEQKMKNYSMNIIILQSYDRFSGNFKYHKLNNIKLSLRNEQQIVIWLWMYRNNIIYSIVPDQKEDKLILTHQLVSTRTINIRVFIYSLSQNQSNATYAQNCLILPTFQYETMLVDILFVPTSQTPKIQTSEILLFYQRESGIQIVQTSYSTPSIIIRKHLYSDTTYIQLIASSIVPERIYLNGIEHCFQNHTILVQTCKGISKNHQLTLLSLPSTGSPKIINQKQTAEQFEYCKNGQDGIWVYSFTYLSYIKIIKKPKIYETLLKLRYPQQINNLHAISNEVLQFLQ